LFTEAPKVPAAVSRDFTVRELTDVHVPTNDVERHIVQKRGGAVTDKA